jgi:hypothetical protein
MSRRRQEGEETGRLKCCRCKGVKPVADFPRNPNVGWSSWCTACHGEYQRGRDVQRSTRTVHARLKPTTIDYLLEEMLPDSAPKSLGWIITKIVNDAVAAHRKACAQVKVRPVASEVRPTNSEIMWPTRQQLMGGR